MKIKTRRLLGVLMQRVGIILLIVSGVWMFLWKTGRDSNDYVARAVAFESYYVFGAGLPTNFLSHAKFSTSWTISDWHTNNAMALQPMFIETNVTPDCRHVSYRLATLDSRFLTFGFYEAKCIGLNGDVVLFPAIGPLSGTRMKWRWPIALLGVSMALIGFGMKIRASVRPDVGGIPLDSRRNTSA